MKLAMLGELITTGQLTRRNYKQDDTVPGRGISTLVPLFTTFYL